MRHPTDGVLRRLLDDPAGVSDADRSHLTGCPQCLTELAGVRRDAALVDAALATDRGAPTTVDAAWQRLSASAAAAPASPGRATSKPGRTRAMLRRPIVAVAVAVAVLAGAGTAAANGWLQIFKTEQVAPVSLNPTDLVGLPDLSAYGDVVLGGDPDVHEVSDATSAAAATGLDVPAVTELPAGVSGEPVYQVGGQVSATFTFSAARAAEAAAAAGQELPPLPAGLDGSQLQLVAGPGVAAIWSQQGGLPTLVVGRAVAPTAFSSGVAFETVRDYLLSLPGLSAELAAQLRAFTADGSTLPLPVPAGQVTSTPDEVNGVPATVLTANDQSMAAVVWVVDGVVTVVAGALDADEVLTVARSLELTPAADPSAGGGDTAVRAAADLVAGLPPSPAVWCSGLRKRYGKRTAVDEVSLTVGRGQVVGLLGPNGAGKTTVIKMLLGLVRPDAGEVMLLGGPAADPESRTRVGYLPELFRYQPWLTAAEVLALHVRLSGVDVPAPEQRACLALVGLGERAGDRVGGFSKGMQQRLGLAVALVARPELVVLDEPTSALDPIGRVDVRDIVLELKSRDVAVLLNSHLIGEVERVCDRVVILDRGRVAAAGTLDELLGQRELRIQLTDVSTAALERLAETGLFEQTGDWFTVALPADDTAAAVPDLVAGLVALGARVHAVEPARISLEERLLGILRAGSGGER